MNRLDHKQARTQMRKNRVRKSVTTSSARPRLSVFISTTNVTAQIVDDTTGKTLAYSTSVGSKEAKGTMTEKAAWVGADIAAKATKQKIKQVVLDRGSKLYHGRVKALAEAARNKGLEF